MNRRETIKSMGLLSMHALFPSIHGGFLNNFIENAPQVNVWIFFNPEEQIIIKEMIDIIIPVTATKSASQVGVHFFLDEVFGKCLNDDQKAIMKSGLATAKSHWKSESDKTSYVKLLDDRAYSNELDFAWFKIIKQYAMVGFFTSEEGTKKAGDYQKFPGGFVGEVSIDPTTLSHSKTFLKFYF